jgi:hypothetical protein
MSTTSALRRSPGSAAVLSLAGMAVMVRDRRIGLLTLDPAPG